MKKRRKRGDEGYALLLIFLMAAIVAISLYRELPRVAFESQRQREQLLIERGEQYKRAFEVFYRENKKFPVKMEDLDKFNNKRYLRQHYSDPLTGKEEWRLIHTNGQTLTDSLVQKSPNQQGQKQDSTSAGSSYVGEIAYVNPNQGAAGNTGVANLANRRRASDQAGPGGGLVTVGVDSNGNPLPGGVPPGGVTPGSIPGQTGLPGQITPVQGGQFPVPGQVPGAPQPGVGGVPLPPGVPQVPGLPGATGNPSASGSSSSGGGSYVGAIGYGAGSTTPTPTPGMPVPGQPGQPTYPVTPGQPGYPQPGTGPAQGQGAALINQILTSPRPGGFPQPGNIQGGPQPVDPNNPNGGFNGQQAGFNGGQQGGFNGQQGGANGQQGSTGDTGFGTSAASMGRPIGTPVGAMIAGVASKADADSIMTYKERTNYKEWEFVGDISPKALFDPLAAVGKTADKLNDKPNTGRSGSQLPMTGRQ